MKTSDLMFMYLLLILHIGAGFYLGKDYCISNLEPRIIELENKIGRIN